MEMIAMGSRTVSAILGFAGGFAVAVAGLYAQAGAGQVSPKAAAGGTSKTAEEVYKNIKVLKGVPADQLMPAMQFIAASLGTGCDFCHVERQPEKDDKKPKETARKMMTMMFAINRDNFEGRRDVTCYSCHRGADKPVAMPILAGEKPLPASTESAPAEAVKDAGADAASLPPPDQILDNYVRALGDEHAVQQIASRIEKGTITAFGGRKFPLEIFSKAPNKQVSVTHFPNGDSATAYDGQSGWLAFPGRPAREMSGSDLYAAELDAGLPFPAGMRQIFSVFKVERKEKFGDRETYVLAGSRQGQPPVELYFDQQSGLLLRQVRYADSPVGLYPTQIDYADYRETDGVKAPFRRTISRPGVSSTVQVDQMQQNAPVDDRKFARPPAPPAAGTKPPSP
jgi:photosynthetic reaction center cytochrome c subunit